MDAPKPFQTSNEDDVKVKQEEGDVMVKQEVDDGDVGLGQVPEREVLFIITANNNSRMLIPPRFLILKKPKSRSGSSSAARLAVAVEVARQTSTSVLRATRL